MTPTKLFCAPDSTADSSPEQHQPLAGVCAIHRPDLFPRLSTLAELVAADYWIVLDDVRFARRGYQHRASAGHWPPRGRRSGCPSRRPCLTAGPPPSGRRGSLIRHAAGRRLGQVLAHQHRRSPHWPAFEEALESVPALFDITDRLAVVTEASTGLLPHAVGWRGQILHSSDLPGAIRHGCPRRGLPSRSTSRRPPASVTRTAGSRSPPVMSGRSPCGPQAGPRPRRRRPCRPRRLRGRRRRGRRALR